MNCETTRQRLLGCERPDRPPADVQPHLAECGACRTWQRRLTRIEEQVSEAPVPPSAPPSDLMRQILQGPPPLPARPTDLTGLTGGSPPWWVAHPDAGRVQPAPIVGRLHPDRPHRPGDRGRQKVALAFALTLGLAIFSLSWGLWPHRTADFSGPGGDRDRVAAFEMRLALARSPKERVHLLSDFADQLQREARGVAVHVDTAELPAMAALYSQLVRDRLPEDARTLPADERDQIVKHLLERLERAESDLETLGATPLSDSSRETLRGMAQATRDGRDRLRALIGVA